jgi:predicted GNAT family N-acyltransferase
MIKDSIYIRQINKADTYPLRISVLRNGAEENYTFEGDSSETTVHLGAFFYGRVIGILSLYGRKPDSNKVNIEFPDSIKREESISWYQVRGMAVDPEYRNMDVGRKLVAETVEIINDKLPSNIKACVWCNARKIAYDFYGKQGFSAVGEPFEIEGIGEHSVMYRLI